MKKISQNIGEGYRKFQDTKFYKGAKEWIADPLYDMGKSFPNIANKYALLMAALIAPHNRETGYMLHDHVIDSIQNLHNTPAIQTVGDFVNAVGSEAGNLIGGMASTVLNTDFRDFLIRGGLTYLACKSAPLVAKSIEGYKAKRAKRKPA